MRRKKMTSVTPRVHDTRATPLYHDFLGHLVPGCIPASIIAIHSG